MIFDHIEKVKQEYTDKYVVVDGSLPELARFKNEVGQVKTVNMSGRALVEFVEYHLNIGWYDIDLDYLKVVDKPAPKEKKVAAKKSAKKAPAKKSAATGAEGKELSPLEMARAQGAKKKEAAADKPSAKVSKGGASGGKMSVADILAAARGDKKSEPAAALEDTPVNDPPGQTTEESIAVEETPTKTEASSEKVDRSAMSPDEMVAWCREHDAS